MKLTRAINVVRIELACLASAAMAMASAHSPAQVFTTLHTFGTLGGVPSSAGGVTPDQGLTLSGDTLYGTASAGGAGGNGALFAIGADGTGFRILHSFTNSAQGALPARRLIISGGVLYGTARNGGAKGNGTVFAINTDGTGFTNLHSFTGGVGGANPLSTLTLSGNMLYGTTFYGGADDNGTVFAINTDGTGFTNLHSFPPGDYTGSAGPCAGVVLSGNTLYGTTLSDGNGGAGAVFALNTDGTGFTNLYSFTSPSISGYSDPQGDTLLTNRDGAFLNDALLLSGGTLYGTALTGGSAGNGTLFAVNLDGTGFTNLHTFTATSGSNFTNNDGAEPVRGLILSGDTLYGTASDGGANGNGTVYAIKTNGTGFTTLYSFTRTSSRNSDGANPVCDLVLSGNTLYGTAQNGGTEGYGTVFSLSFRPRLTATASGAGVILTWPTNYAGFDYSGYVLQSAVEVGPSAVWTTNSTPQVLVNGLNTVTNPISGPARFFRLKPQ